MSTATRSLWIFSTLLFAVAGSIHLANAVRLRGTNFPLDPLVYHYTHKTLDYYRMQLGADDNPSYNYDTFTYQQTVDHFSFFNSTTFNQRYLVSTEYWRLPSDPAGPGPIFLYTGNEGPIDLFANNTGFMWDIAPEFGAMLVFIEHRYYGESFPFNNATIAYSTPETIQYLTHEQALADFAQLITDLKVQYNCVSSPVIAFGGSYGGMLSAWFRMKYPHVVAGAIAASAPILQFTNITAPTVYASIVTNTFYTANPHCSATIFYSWNRLLTMKNFDAINAAFPDCNGFKFNSSADVENVLFGFLAEAYQYMAMADYPYPASFLGPMPENPVTYACEKFDSDNPSDAEMLSQLSYIMNVFWDYTNVSNCFNLTASAPSTLGPEYGWSYQSCTEMVMPIGYYGTGPDSDMFFPSPWSLEEFIQSCQAPFNLTNGNFAVTPRVNWIVESYGGKNIGGFSNIVFSNGDRDPWSGGGVVNSVSDNIIAINITGGAHHLDLRSKNIADPDSVTLARNQERAYIKAWINGNNESTELDPKWIVLISVGGTLLTVFIAMCLWVYCQSKPRDPNLYESMNSHSAM